MSLFDTEEMDFDEWKGVIQCTATITTVINFLTGFQVIRGFIRKGTTGDASGVTFVAGALNCCIWLKYGLLINDIAMKLVNAIGATLLTTYSLTFYNFTPHRTTAMRQIAFAVTFFFTIIFYVDTIDEELDHARHILGIVGSSLAVCFFASPLASLAHVIRTGSTEVLPFPIILSSFFVSGQWWLYGIILNDNFVKIPNFLGWLLASFQLMLFVLYPAKRKNSLLPSSNPELAKPLL